MSYTLGRLVDHLGLWASDAAASRRFYGAILAALGREAEDDGDTLNSDELYVAASAAGTVTRGLHLCFQAGSRAKVDAFHAAGLDAGGRDNGAPGLRDYHPGYYAAFLLDPDGNNIEAKVDERVTTRSAAAISVRTG